jgi:hypothetical protein
MASRWTRQVAVNRRLDLTRPRLSSVGHADLQAIDAFVGWKSTVGNLTQQDTWRSSERWTRCAASVACATDVSIAPKKHPVKGQRLYSFVGL